METGKLFWHRGRANLAHQQHAPPKQNMPSRLSVEDKEDIVGSGTYSITSSYKFNGRQMNNQRVVCNAPSGILNDVVIFVGSK